MPGWRHPPMAHRQRQQKTACMVRKRRAGRRRAPPAMLPTQMAHGSIVIRLRCASRPFTRIKPAFPFGMYQHAGMAHIMTTACIHLLSWSHPKTCPAVWLACMEYRNDGTHPAYACGERTLRRWQQSMRSCSCPRCAAILACADLHEMALSSHRHSTGSRLHRWQPSAQS